MSVRTLSLHDIVSSRGDRRVLDHVDLVVAPGHRVGVVGPNGVGKSTLLAVCAGAVRPERGQVRLAPPTATVGWLHQEPERGDETVTELLARGPASPPLTPSSTPPPTPSRPATPTPPIATTSRGSAGWRSAPPTSTRGSARLPHELGIEQRLLAQSTATLSGGEAARAVAGGAAALAVRRVPARRADQRPRPRRARSARAVGARARRGGVARQPRPPVPRPGRHRRRRDRRVHPRRDDVRRRLAGVPRRACARPAARMGAVRGVRLDAQGSRRPGPAPARVGAAGRRHASSAR